MAWNGSQRAGYSATNKASSTPQKKSLFHSSTSTSNFNSHSPLRSQPSTSTSTSKRAALVAVALAALGGAALFYILSPAPAPAPSVGPDRQAGRTIKETAPYKSLDDISRVKPRKSYPSKAKTVDEALERLDEAQDPMLLDPLPKTGKNSAPRKMLFKSGTEQVLSWLCHVELGDPPIPPPPIPENELDNFASILISKNEVTEDDSPEAANAKQMVDAAKKEMAKFIREGGDPDEFMQYVFREQAKAFETRCMAQEMYDELAEEDPAVAREFAAKINDKLADEGILPIQDEESAKSTESTEENKSDEDSE